MAMIHLSAIRSGGADLVSPLVSSTRVSLEFVKFHVEGFLSLLFLFDWFLAHQKHMASFFHVSITCISSVLNVTRTSGAI